MPLFSFVRHSIDSLGQAVKQRLRQWTKPDQSHAGAQCSHGPDAQQVETDARKRAPASAAGCVATANEAAGTPKVFFLRPVLLHKVSDSQHLVDGRATPFQHLLSIDRMDGLCPRCLFASSFGSQSSVGSLRPLSYCLSEGHSPRLSDHPHRLSALWTTIHK